MRATRSGVILSNIGMMLLGVVAAILLARGIGWLWPAMTLPVFFVALLCVVMGGVSVMLRDRGKRDINPVSWSTAREYTTFSPTNSMLSNLATILFGVVLATLIAGLVGRLWSAIRWPVFFVVLLIWMAAGIGVILSDRGKPH